MVKLNGCIFFFKIVNYQKNIMIFWKKSSLVLKKNLIVNTSTIKFFWKTKYNLTVIRLQIFMIKKFQK